MYKLVRTLTAGQFIVHPSNQVKFTSTKGVCKLVGSYPEEEVLVVSSGKRADMEALKRALDVSDVVCGKADGIVAEKGGPAASKDSTSVSFVEESQTQKPLNSLAPSESKSVSSLRLEGPSAAKDSNGASLVEGSQTQKPPISPAPSESETVSTCPDPDILAQDIRSVLLEDTNESDLNDDPLRKDEESIPEEVDQIAQLEKDLALAATNTNKPINRDPKETFCLFCSCKVRRFQRHLEAQHKTEEKVAEILKMECRSKKRRDAVAKLRNEGSFLHNINAKDEKEFIVARRDTKSTLAFCPGCKGSYSKKSLYRHKRNCCSDIPPRSVVAKGHNVVVAAKFSKSNIETVPSEGFKPVLKSMLRKEIYEVILSDMWKLFPDTPHPRSPQRDTSWDDRPTTSSGREFSEDETTAPSSPPVLKKRMSKKATKRSLMNDVDDDDSSPEKKSPTIRRLRWTKQEKKSVWKHFGRHLKNLTLPTLPDCRKVIERHRHLMHRTPEQMKAYINNQNRKRKKAESDGTQKKIMKTLPCIL